MPGTTSVTTETTNPIETAQIMEPIKMAGGESAISFDDLEAVENHAVRQRVHELKEEKTAQDQFKEEEAQTTETKTKSKKEDGDGEKKTQTTDDKTQADDKLLEDAVAKQKDVAKLIKLKSGDSDVELQENTLVPVKINGKIEQVQIKEMLKSYSGQTHLDRQVTVLRQEQKKLQTERHSLQHMVDTSYNLLVKDHDLRGFCDYVAGAMGTDGETIYKDMVSKFRDDAKAFLELPEDERKLRDAKEDGEYWRRKQERNLADTKTQKEQTEMFDRTEKIMQEFEIDKPEFVKVYDEILKSGKIKEEEITPELVGDVYNIQKQTQRVVDVLKKVSPDLADQDKTVLALREVVVREKLNNEDLEILATEVYGNSAEKKLGQKIKESDVKVESTTTAANPDKDPLTWDDI